MKTLFFFLFCFIFFLITINTSFAGGAVETQKHALQQRRAQQQAVEAKMYQQALQQRQMQQQAAQRAAYQQVATQQIAKQQINAYQGAIAKQQAMAAQMAAQQMPRFDETQYNQTDSSVPSRRHSRQQDEDELISDDPDEIVDIKDLWKDLETSSEAWPMMMDMAPKIATIEKYKDFFKQQGIGIVKSSESYVELIDEMILQNPTFLQNPFQDLFRVMAIMEYDFDNGQDRDELARRMLGPEIYEQNKKRLGR